MYNHTNISLHVWLVEKLSQGGKIKYNRRKGEDNIKKEKRGNK